MLSAEAMPAARRVLAAEVQPVGVLGKSSVCARLSHRGKVFFGGKDAHIGMVIVPTVVRQ